MQRLQLDTCCYAVDTWKGDEHAGFYGEEVFRDVRNHNDQRYSAFSTLIRSTFDEASHHFRKQSIDLLHIDGRHFYDDVKHDFETWQPKLSNRAVVVFHDTNVRERDFGVFALWKELCQERPHFEFFHGHGLGILGIGNDLPDRILALFAARANVEASTQIRRAYSRLGSAVTFQVRSEQVQLAAESQVAGLNKALAERDARVAALQQALAERDARVAALEQALSERNSKRRALQQALAEWDVKVSALDQARAERKLTKLSMHGQGGTVRNQQDQSRLLQVNQLNSLADRRQSVPEDREADGKLLEESGLFDADAYRAAAGIDAATNAAEHYLAVGWRQKIDPGPDFEGRFLEPYFRSAGFDGPPAMTYIRLRAAGWPVYATHAQAEPVATFIRTSNLFDARGLRRAPQQYRRAGPGTALCHRWRANGTDAFGRF